MQELLVPFKCMSLSRLFNRSQLEGRKVAVLSIPTGSWSTQHSPPTRDHRNEWEFGPTRWRDKTTHSKEFNTEAEIQLAELNGVRCINTLFLLNIKSTRQRRNLPKVSTLVLKWLHALCDVMLSLRNIQKHTFLSHWDDCWVKSLWNTQQNQKVLHQTGCTSRAQVWPLVAILRITDGQKIETLHLRSFNLCNDILNVNLLVVQWYKQKYYRMNFSFDD